MAEPAQIETITTPFFPGISVNCYLIERDGAFILIDTARRGQRAAVEAALNRAGCSPGKLRLILLTHGDFDHCGNAAYLRRKYQTRVAMHLDDRGMVEQGDMFWNRKQPNALIGFIFRRILSLPKDDQFTPDLWLKEGDDLSVFGFDARVIELPGHSRGNIGLLTDERDLFCGDLLGNLGQPKLWSLIDDPAAAAASVEKLRPMPIRTVYPGHGKAFRIKELWEIQ
ncbi:MAG: MBL fold metallo-hydrolase [Anaerolineae bacterium]|nr:MBL fold metallo-hydrolase [Anaerolineae bacterium]